MKWIHAARARLRLLFAGRAAESRMAHEIQFHIDMEAERLMREESLAPDEARRRAMLSFGGVEKYHEELRSGRGLAWLSGFSLDLKLGVRMLVKFPGLALVGGLAMAFAIFVGAVTFEFLGQTFNPSLPLPEGDRVVGVLVRDAEAGNVERQVLHDVAAWRDLKTIQHVGAFRTTSVNLITPHTAGEPLPAAEMDASGFRVAGVAPLMGRTLTDDDQAPGAEPVVVIGHDVWQSRFNGDRGVLGQPVTLGATVARVVGVMPEGFGFPVNHNVWLPLRINEGEFGRREGPQLSVFGRLAPGASMRSAQAELAAFGRAMAAEYPDTHEHLRPQVGPYARTILNLGMSGELDLSNLSTLLRGGLNLPLILFLLLVSGNIALLVFARAATRDNEIIVRTVLGASRRRIMLQLFAEALVLGAVAAVFGLMLADFGLDLSFWLATFEMGALPFWFDPTLSAGTIMYAVFLTLAAAVVAGVLPALKVTRGLADRMRQASAGGGGFRFGGVWSAVVVAQIAVTIPFPIIVWAVRWEAATIRAVDIGVAEERYLAARLHIDRPTGPDSAVVRLSRQEMIQGLEQRMEAERGIAGVTFASQLPRMYHPYSLMEIDEGEAAPLDPRWPAYRVSSISVATDYFDVLEVPMISGRNFSPADTGAPVVIVNQSFVERVMGGRSPIGRRVRFQAHNDGDRAQQDAPWLQIVGVVQDLGLSYGESDPKEAGVYQPMVPGSVFPVHMALHVPLDRDGAAQRIRPIAASVDPMLRVHDISRLDELNLGELRFYRIWFWVSLAGSSVALLLSLAGIYAVMAFTVAQRTREIGIRVALGADRLRVVRAIFRRPMQQVALGVLTGGTALGLMLLTAADGVMPPLKVFGALALYLTIMMAVCMLAWVVPTRRALAVEPQEALRWE